MIPKRPPSRNFSMAISNIGHSFFADRERSDLGPPTPRRPPRFFPTALVTTNAVKEAYAVSIQSTKALKEALINVLNLDDDDKEILTTISSTKGILAAWTEIGTLTEAMLACLDRTTAQVETHLHLAADEQTAHESAHLAASESLLSCTDSLLVVDRSIAQKGEHYPPFVAYRPKSSCESL